MIEAMKSEESRIQYEWKSMLDYPAYFSSVNQHLSYKQRGIYTP